MNQIRVHAIHSLYNSGSLQQIDVLFSHNQGFELFNSENTAQMISDLILGLDDKETIPKFNISPIAMSRCIKFASIFSSLEIMSPVSMLELLNNSKSLSNLGNTRYFNS
ncbi:hypothetical protein RF11_11910 [Thelohanellus kitauei]|uniref:Uncharacterized protein n=1 Tax=Thelohanellus kitauei TaxID=669202 RepID=A0A0C2N2F7_THEKT|nr:hypothetical protein RF11_11910 [Thelohanellus kitauei]